MTKLNKISLPNYSLAEEIINSISHGIGAALSIAALVLLVVAAAHTGNALSIVTVTIFGTTMIILYTMSCIYHALSPKLAGKKVLKVLDHCNVFLLVLGTYCPVSLLGIHGKLGILLFLLVATITTTGIVFSAINVDKYKVIAVICHLISGWSILIGIKELYTTMTLNGLILLIAGGISYSIGAILYGIGFKVKYMHCVFHFFCLAGTILHFLSIYLYIL